MWLHSIRTKHMESYAIPKIGDIRRVTSAFTFLAPDEAWLQGGNGRTDKSREPMGCLGDQGWYPIGAIMFGFGYALPHKVQATHAHFNKVDTIVSLSGTIWFGLSESGMERVATFDCGCELAHRSCFEIVGNKGVIRVEDQVGGEGHTGDLYNTHFKGSRYYKVDDVRGKEEVVEVEPCVHEMKMIEDFSSYVLQKQLHSEWAHKSLRAQAVLDAIFLSATNGCVPVTIHSSASGVQFSLPSTISSSSSSSSSSASSSASSSRDRTHDSALGTGCLLLGAAIGAAAIWLLKSKVAS